MIVIQGKNIYISLYFFLNKWRTGGHNKYRVREARGKWHFTWHALNSRRPFLKQKINKFLYIIYFAVLGAVVDTHSHTHPFDMDIDWQCSMRAVCRSLPSRYREKTKDNRIISASRIIHNNNSADLCYGICVRFTHERFIIPYSIRANLTWHIADVIFYKSVYDYYTASA